MFPAYMNDMLRDARCGYCNEPQSLADIQIVGVRRPEEFEAFRGEPVFIIVMSCKSCGQWTNHTMRRPRTDAIAGCASYIDLIERECDGKKPPLNIPGLEKDAAARRAAQRPTKSRPRPSIRHDQPTTPPTPREIQQFLHRLRKTSFKRGTKGLHRWMKDIGANTNTGDKADEDQQKGA